MRRSWKVTLIDRVRAEESEAQDPLGEAAIPPRAQAFHLRDGQATLKPETFKESVPLTSVLALFADVHLKMPV